MRTLLTIIATFLLTTLFWFSVPTVRQVVATNYVKNAKKFVADSALSISQNEQSSDSDKQIKAYEKRIKDLESQLRKANTKQSSNTTRREMTDLAVSKTAASTVRSTETPTYESTPKPTSSGNPTQESLSIVGTWKYDNPQTAEERDYQLVFNAYGAFKYYNTKMEWTLRDAEYSISGSKLKIGYNSGTYNLSSINGVDYLEISGIKDYAGKLIRVK